MDPSMFEMQYGLAKLQTKVLNQRAELHKQSVACARKTRALRRMRRYRDAFMTVLKMHLTEDQIESIKADARTYFKEGEGAAEAVKVTEEIEGGESAG